MSWKETFPESKSNTGHLRITASTSEWAPRTPLERSPREEPISSDGLLGETPTASFMISSRASSRVASPERRVFAARLGVAVSRILWCVGVATGSSSTLAFRTKPRLPRDAAPRPAAVLLSPPRSTEATLLGHAGVAIPSAPVFLPHCVPGDVLSDPATSPMPAKLATPLGRV